MSPKKTIHYHYAGLDFMLDQQGNLVFLEANAVPGGIYVMDRANEVLLEKKPSWREKIGNSSLARTFVESTLNFYFEITGTIPKLVAITTPLLGGLSLMPERAKIMDLFRMHGVSAIIVNRRKYLVKATKFFIRLGNRLIAPDLIIRRNTDFPKNIEQITINKSEVGVITGSKIRTYNILSRYIRSTNLFRLPKTFFTKKIRNIKRYTKELLHEGNEVIIKPNKGEKGKGIYLIRKEEDLDRILPYLKDYSSYLIQERIKPYELKINGKNYVFDIRAYVFFGKFANAHIRRAKNSIGIGSWSDWGISNVALGGRYVPIIRDSQLGTIRWNNKQVKLKPFKSIIVDNYAFAIDNNLYENLVKASELIVSAIDRAMNEFLERGER